MTDFRNDQGTGVVTADGFVGSVDGAITAAQASTVGGNAIAGVKAVTITVVNGAAAGTFAMPAGAIAAHYYIDTATAIPGTPTNTYLRLGSAANGEQYVADVDVKAQGWINATVVYAGRHPATTVHYTVASSGGTTASQDGTVMLYVEYFVPAA